MIEVIDRTFFLSTEATSYIFELTKFNHLESIYYAERISDTDITPLKVKRNVILGSCVVYDESDELYCLDVIPLEYSTPGKGDFRHPPAEIKMPDKSYVSDFKYMGYEIVKGVVTMATLPGAYAEDDEAETLIIKLKDSELDVDLSLYYTVFYEENVITRRCVLKNNEANPLVIRKLMSMNIDLSGSDYSLLTLDGSWIKETHKNERKLRSGLYVNESLTGASSNRHNPGIIVYRGDASEDHGSVYGFNLIYSGNHYEAVELTNTGLVRVMSGINPHCFEWKLDESESFETPEAVLTYSDKGFNGVSHNFHDFINKHIIRGDWKNKTRPVLINDWESYFFKFTQTKLLRLAKRAQALGVEMFVLDDGWFGERNLDNAGLGDYFVNKKKLPKGLNHLAKKINKLGMKFGLWFEPEMVNENSELFRAHPDYVIKVPNRAHSRGRNQLVLDLCKTEVRDYIVKNVREVLESANIEYVKWDMNRHMSDMFSEGVIDQGRFFHSYIIGLYDVLNRIFFDKPYILFESCSSGGNRFDLGMLCFSQQVWSSDNTDPIERLDIQSGLTYFYPLSTISAHVSASPHMFTLRVTPLSTRANVSFFGVFGLELDLKFLNRFEKKELKNYISEYKRLRDVFQFGDFYRFDSVKDNQTEFMCVAKNKLKAACGLFQIRAVASPENDVLMLKGLSPEKKYALKSIPKTINIKRFGGLINFLLPFKVSADGFIVRMLNRFISLNDAVEEYKATGKLLMGGVRLNNQFSGSGYNADIRMMGDFGSILYVIDTKEV